MKDAQKNFTLILLLIIAVAVIGGGAYLYFQQKKGAPSTSIDTQLETTTTLNNDEIITTADSKSEAVNKIQPKTPPSTQTSSPILKVVTAVTIGAGQPDEALLAGEHKEFKISQKDTTPTEFAISDGKLTLKAVEAHEQTDINFVPYTREVCSRDRSWCQDIKDWIIVSVNGTNIEFGREEIKQITFSNGLKINMVFADIEGSSSNYYGSDGGFVIIK